MGILMVSPRSFATQASNVSGLIYDAVEGTKFFQHIQKQISVWQPPDVVST